MKNSSRIVAIAAGIFAGVAAGFGFNEAAVAYSGPSRAHNEQGQFAVTAPTHAQAVAFRSQAITAGATATWSGDPSTSVVVNVYWSNSITVGQWWDAQQPSLTSAGFVVVGQ